jgi:hypothetical protein
LREAVREKKQGLYRTKEAISAKKTKEASATVREEEMDR